MSDILLRDDIKISYTDTQVIAAATAPAPARAQGIFPKVLNANIDVLN